jgi:ApbE superfamily uncharacterized protein (UPF0280 family)
MHTSDSNQRPFYRDQIATKDLVSFSIVIEETDLLILADRNLQEEAEKAVLTYRQQLETHISTFPEFASTLKPLSFQTDVPPLIREMLKAARLAQVGPMASVAGALAEQVGRDLLEHTPQVIVENGGDIFLAVSHDITVGIYAGNSPLSNKLAVKIPSAITPLGVCTSSGTVGHSLSFGSADAVTVIAHSTALADATATALGNRVNDATAIEEGLEAVQHIEGIAGALIIVDDHFGAWGNIEIVPT